MAEMTAN